MIVLNYASRTKRFGLPSRMGFVMVLALAGCQTGGQSDLVTRELRMQEDQIYAMEDYLSQYQQLLCEVRAENAALKRQLAEMDRGEALPTPAGRGDSSNKRAPAPARGPSFQSPRRAPGETEQESTEMDVEIIEPEVPPLDTPTSMRPRLEVRGQSPDEPVAGEWKVVGPMLEEKTEASGDVHEKDVGNDASTVDESTQGKNERLSLSNDPTRFVWIEGEVLANTAGGGPRIVVDVEPLSVAMEPTRFAGSVSLMLLEALRNGPPHSLARWDYSAADAAKVLDEMPNHRTMRFHLELPPDTPTDRPTEFWVRLMPEIGGGKVLGHVRVDLSRAGRFASMVGEVSPRDGYDDRQPDGALAAIAKINNNLPTPAFDAGDDKGWTIARPDRPGQIGAGVGEARMGWRAASGPLPAVVESVAVPTQPTPTIARPGVQQAAFVDDVKGAAVQEAPIEVPAERVAVRTTPVWTPERDGKPAGGAKTRSEGQRSSTGPARPAWSPVR